MCVFFLLFLNLSIMKDTGVVILLLSFLPCYLLDPINVVLIGHNVTTSFDAIEANFTPGIEGSGECGVMYLAEPLDACEHLTNRIERVSNCSSPFVLMIRGGCSFEEKVRTAQRAGFRAAIVYDNEDEHVLVSMAGKSAGINIHAVFVSRDSGEALKQYVGSPDVELWLIQTFENSAWSIIILSFVSLLAMSAVLATCFFVRRYRIRRERPLGTRIREFRGMSSRLVKAMPTLIFTSVQEDKCTSMTCSICLEDYIAGEKLRILPCQHKFHAFCVDYWLTSWRTFCPVCKRDARTNTGDLPASESTPLLSSSSASMASSSMLSSYGSELSSAIQIAPASSPSPSMSHIPSLPHISYSFTPYNLQSTSSSYRRRSPSLNASRISTDLRNMPSQTSMPSHLVSSHSLGLPYPSVPLSTRHMSAYTPSSSNNLPSFVFSGNLPPRPLRYSESAMSFSPYASAQSLPEC